MLRVSLESVYGPFSFSLALVTLRSWRLVVHAFYDHATPGRTAARGYLISAGQFADIAAQEMHRDPRTDDPLEQLVLAPLAEATVVREHELGVEEGTFVRTPAG